MKCPSHRTTAFGNSADSVVSGITASETLAGLIPAYEFDAGWMGYVGDAIYRLARTTPTA